MIDHADIRARFTKLATERLGKEPSEIIDAATLRDDLGADSLDIVEVIFDIEEEFDIDISDDECEHLSTVRTALDLIEKLVEAKA